MPVLIVLSALLLFTSACSSFRVCDDRWTGRDKAYHVTAAAWADGH